MQEPDYPRSPALAPPGAPDYPRSPALAPPGAPDYPSTLVVACGALARELRAVLGQLPTAGAVDVEYLPAPLHNRPREIAPRVDALLTEHGPGHTRLVVAYADCGTGGALDRVLARHGAQRLPGAHCYELFAGSSLFARLHEAEPGTFYLTDFLARHFDALVITGLGLDRHPELRDTYFANYRRLVYLSQSEDAALVDAARRAAATLGLVFAHEPVGLGPFAVAFDAALASTLAGVRN